MTVLILCSEGTSYEFAKRFASQIRILFLDSMPVEVERTDGPDSYPFEPIYDKRYVIVSVTGENARDPSLYYKAGALLRSKNSSILGTCCILIDVQVHEVSVPLRQYELVPLSKNGRLDGVALRKIFEDIAEMSNVRLSDDRDQWRGVEEDLDRFVTAFLREPSGIEKLAYEVRSGTGNLASDEVLRIKGMPIPGGYRKLKEPRESFFSDDERGCSNYDKNVFIMTRFLPGNRVLESIDNTIRTELKSVGLEGHRADDRVYPDDRNLWDNVCTYMVGCKYGIAVLEDVLRWEFNPNVALEYGFMRALGKPVLLLKEQRMIPRADILGTLWEEFDVFEIEMGITNSIRRWVRDLGYFDFDKPV
jgi:hypothetical protein